MITEITFRKKGKETVCRRINKVVKKKRKERKKKRNKTNEKSHLNATHERQMNACWKRKYLWHTAALFSPRKR